MCRRVCHDVPMRGVSNGLPGGVHAWREPSRDSRLPAAAGHLAAAAAAAAAVSHLL